MQIRRDNVDTPASLPTQLQGLVAFREVEPGIYEPVVLESSGSALHVQPRSGTGARDRNRSLVNVTTRQAVHWPAGADIRNLTVFAMLEEGTTLTAGQELDVYAVLCIDASNDTEADGNLGTTSNPPSSATADANFIPVPLGKFVSIPLTDALVNGLYGGGRVDVRSVDGTALNIWIGAN